MACAYVGTTLMPPAFGLIAEHIHVGLYPVFLMIFVVIMFFMTAANPILYAPDSTSRAAGKRPDMQPARPGRFQWGTVAAKWASLFYLGITAGRFLCGFITEKLGDRNMGRLGQGKQIS
mgnify:CR=1 FL=1